MKKYFTIAAIALATLGFAQQAGEAGELLKNEASNTEMRTKKQSVPTDNSRSSNSVLTYPNGMRGQNGSMGNNRYPNYHWNQNYGNSEVFLRIPERGYYTVELGDQMITNTTGRFRFFDLGSGKVPISIYDNGFLVYRTRINLRSNTRMVLDFFSNRGLYLLTTVPVNMQWYGYNQWDDVWNSAYGNGGYGNNGYGNNNPYGNNGYGDNNPYGNGGYSSAMSSSEFQQLYGYLQRASFDSQKMQIINQQASGNQFSSQQIYNMLRLFTSDHYRLNTAKRLYDSCTDRQNFQMVYSLFKTQYDRTELMRYVDNR